MSRIFKVIFMAGAVGMLLCACSSDGSPEVHGSVSMSYGTGYYGGGYYGNPWYYGGGYPPTVVVPPGYNNRPGNGNRPGAGGGGANRPSTLPAHTSSRPMGGGGGGRRR